jgi:hypothetical protein
MTTFYQHRYVMQVVVKLDITMSDGELFRELTLTEATHGHEVVQQVSDMFMSACDLTRAVDKLRCNG